MSVSKRYLTAAAIFIVGTVLNVNVSNAGSVADFYKGKTLKVIVASSAGGRL